MNRTKSRLTATVNPASVENDALASFLTFWNSKRSSPDVPRRQDFLPEEMKPHLGDLFIVCPIEGYSDFKYRLVGTNITALNGRDYTGMTVKEVFAVCGDQEAQEAVRAYTFVTRKQVPLRVTGGMLWASKSYITFDSLLLPIKSPNGEECWILAKLVVSDVADTSRLSYAMDGNIA